MATKLLNNIVKIQDNLDDILDLTDIILRKKTYHELTYIEGTGTQWIDTNIKGSDTLKTELRAMAKSISSKWVSIFGARTGYAENGYFVFHKSESHFGFGYNQKYDETKGDVTLDVISKVTIDNATCTVVNENTGSQFVITGTSGVFITDYSLTIGALNNHGDAQPTPFRFYGCKFWKSGELIRDLIPVTRISDDKACVYDKVSGIFLENQGTGEFIARRS